VILQSGLYFSAALRFWAHLSIRVYLRPIIPFQFPHKRHIPLQEIVSRKTSARLPHNLLEVQIPRLPREPGHMEEVQPSHRSAGILDIVRIQRSADDGLDPQLLSQLPLKRRLRRLARFQLPSRKLPFERVPRSALALTDQDEAAALDHRRRHLNFRWMH
jgi:hypothetical protein